MRLNALLLFVVFLAGTLVAGAQAQQSSYGFLSLSGSNDKSNAVITWETIQELTITHFDVQQSSDGHNFTTIGTVSAKYDTSSTRNQYQFVQRNAGSRSKLLYYRLQIGVNNGRILYSKVFMVRFDAITEDQLSIHPNTVRSTLPIAIETAFEGNARLQLVDLSGRLVHTENIQLQPGTYVSSVDVSNIAQGHYIAIITGNGLRLQQRFFRQ